MHPFIYGVWWLFWGTELWTQLKKGEWVRESGERGKKRKRESGYKGRWCFSAFWGCCLVGGRKSQRSCCHVGILLWNVANENKPRHWFCGSDGELGFSCLCNWPRFGAWFAVHVLFYVLLVLRRSGNGFGVVTAFLL
jgi:hypothetical protein